MRLLYLTRTYSVHDARWLRALTSQGLRLGFLSLQKVNQAEFIREHAEVELLATAALPPGAATPLLDRAVPGVSRIIAEWGADAILAGPLTDAGYLAARIAPERTLFMSWAFDVLHEACADAGARERLQVALASASHLFADCQFVRTRCEALALRSFPRTCVVPWGLAATDKPEPSRGWRKRLGDEAAKVVVSPRGFSPVHRPAVVLEAFRQAHARDGALRLWLPGTSGRRDEVVRLAQRLGLGDVVRFLGQLDQASLAGCFSEADVYFAAASSDGSSISLLQAMHAGLPCVVSDLPSNREWLGSEGGGYGSDPASFAQELSRLTRLAPPVREHMAAYNRAQVTTRADLSANLPHLIEALRQIAAAVELPVGVPA